MFSSISRIDDGLTALLSPISSRLTFSAALAQKHTGESMESICDEQIVSGGVSAGVGVGGGGWGGVEESIVL
ncbi:Hypothetical predicted protein [Octopus vulgaris]|uniref:Uncharacterized protein n=1 Tax=Octopus vulgaris TaxID=6645 RepID=A0AA36BV56_OCTVU|nr:Hypothetical predicted protein [Octopus vulgaris]